MCAARFAVQRSPSCKRIRLKLCRWLQHASPGGLVILLLSAWKSVLLRLIYRHMGRHNSSIMHLMQNKDGMKAPANCCTLRCMFLLVFGLCLAAGRYEINVITGTCSAYSRSAMCLIISY
jgi:hypothetical protein